jgi:hypothetical protein
MPKNVKGPHYLVVDGVPFCQNPDTSTIPVCEAKIVCQCEGSHAAIRAVKKLSKILTEHRIEYKEGRCPRDVIETPEQERAREFITHEGKYVGD